MVRHGDLDITLQKWISCGWTKNNSIQAGMRNICTQWLQRNSVEECTGGVSTDLRSLILLLGLWKKEAYLLRIHLHDSVNNTRRESQLRFCGGGQTFDSLEHTVASFVSTTDDTVGKGMTWGWEWVGQLLKTLSLSHALTFTHSQRTPLCVIYQPLLHKWWQMLVD